ncbi:unnamed protein product [Protopolystoma xenopodis]|uniref:Uncharacterized protein n=1 Tax=Protopolystoma xenopodis TaxID=117903 RepID=A0A3S5AKK6_9PLAT|nr:unnamed protein product [Protopolystoma xenopodis]
MCAKVVIALRSFRSPHCGSQPKPNPASSSKKPVAYFPPAPYGVYTGVLPDLVIGVACLVASVLLSAALLLVFWLAKSTRRRSQRALRRQAAHRCYAASGTGLSLWRHPADPRDTFDVLTPPHLFVSAQFLEFSDHKLAFFAVSLHSYIFPTIGLPDWVYLTLKTRIVGPRNHIPRSVSVFSDHPARVASRCLLEELIKCQIAMPKTNVGSFRLVSLKLVILIPTLQAPVTCGHGGMKKNPSRGGVEMTDALTFLPPELLVRRGRVDRHLPPSQLTVAPALSQWASKQLLANRASRSDQHQSDSSLADSASDGDEIGGQSIQSGVSCNSYTSLCHFFARQP